MTDTIKVKNNRIERIFVLAKTEFRQRYFDSYLGLFWALLNPIFRVAVFYIVFTVVFMNKTEHFALYLFSGICLWIFFSESTKKGIVLLRSKAYLIKNISINRLDIYISSVFSSFIGLIFNLAVYFLVGIFFEVEYSWSLLFLPVILITVFFFVVAVSLILSSLFVYFRDLNHLWDIVLLGGFWSVPIIWKQEIVYEQAMFLLYANPITGILINLREVLLMNTMPTFWIMGYNILYTAVLFLIGMLLMKNIGRRAVELS